MMNRFLLLLLICASNPLLGQDVLQSAQTEVYFDSNGDPLNNISRANGAKHGTWTYKDINNQVFYKQIFNNNQLAASYVSFENGQEGSWIILTDFQSYDSVRSLLRNKMINLFDNHFDKQYLIVHIDGTFKSYFIGEWTSAEVAQFNNIIELLLAENSYEISSKFFIYVD